MGTAFPLSARVRGLKPSATVAVTSRALELRRAGADVLSLSVGEPDFETPPHVGAAGIAAIEAGHTRYTPVNGLPELREAVSAKFARENGLDYAPGDVMVSSGGKQAIFNALLALLNPGDEVLIPAPYWVSYPEMVALTGAVPISVPTRAESSFVLDPEELAARITPRTRLIVLNSPGNPTGAVYPAQVLEAVAELARRHDLYLLSDEIYEHLVYDAGHVSPARYAPERTLTVNGASKAYAMTGWRIGYAGGPREWIAAMNALQSQSTTGACTVSQYAALTALTEHGATARFVAQARAAYRERRDFLVAGLNGLGLPTPTPQGAFYVLPDSTRLHPDELEASRLLLEQGGLAVVPGTEFGAPGRVRLSYAAGLDTLGEALRRIEAVLTAED
ncbi:aspartate aminotransferase [Deinococcus sp. HSC-46F16]|uniref:pyridoxal phosphate-dependent aminotransferase n=1 Tax=Deinococcus sp. HSC-46F16 TaxID=2910968 RepID=UPI00209E91C6|nr:pyridoxal phosphate-dependent aminotransferase [Deinococcus sp. HSC-46F16]MCP2012962.1 aspartate aminotransferase [Deinococcus sp. HSC-46F16]